MSKQGMKRPERTHIKKHNDVSPVPEIQGKAKHGKTHVNPIIAGTSSPSLKVYHSRPTSLKILNPIMKNRYRQFIRLLIMILLEIILKMIFRLQIYKIYSN